VNEEDCILAPFALKCHNPENTQPYPSSLTVASVLIELENQRKKGGGLFKKEGEKNDFISPLRYPLTLIPWNDDKYVVLDPMGIWSRPFDQGVIPDTNEFKSSLEKSSDNPESHLGFLMNRQEYFVDFYNIGSISVNGVIVPDELRMDIVSQVNAARNSKVKKDRTLPSIISRLSMETKFKK